MSDLIKILQIADVVQKDIKSFRDRTHEYCSSNEFHIVQVYGDFKICYNTMTCYVISNGYNNECLKIRKYSKNVLSNYQSNNMVLYYNEKNEYPDFIEVTPDAYFNYVLENPCIFTYDELKFIKNMDNSNSIIIQL